TSVHLRTVLRPPSPPTSQSASNISVPPGVAAVTVTVWAVCETSVTLCEKRTAAFGKAASLLRMIGVRRCCSRCSRYGYGVRSLISVTRSEEHTSELQSRGHLVCRLLLEKKKNDEYDNKLLVLQDGRTMYTPLFSGVFWNV